MASRGWDKDYYEKPLLCFLCGAVMYRVKIEILKVRIISTWICPECDLKLILEKRTK